MNDQLIYKIADCFQTDLYLVDKQIRGVVQGHTMNLGDIWAVRTDVTICVDENTDKLVTAFVRVCGNLWGYMMSTEKGVWMIFFDNDHVKLRVGGEKEFGLGNAKSTIGKLKNAMTRAFFCSHNRDAKFKWEPVDLTTVNA